MAGAAAALSWQRHDPVSLAAAGSVSAECTSFKSREIQMRLLSRSKAGWQYPAQLPYPGKLPRTEGRTKRDAASVVSALGIVALASGSVPDVWRELIGILALLSGAYAGNDQRPSPRAMAKRNVVAGIHRSRRRADRARPTAPFDKEQT
ncbi:MAG: hypothetical protein ABIZ50_03855 [Solirubrobacterales bacterium]